MPVFYWLNPLGRLYAQSSSSARFAIRACCLAGILSLTLLADARLLAQLGNEAVLQPTAAKNEADSDRDKATAPEPRLQFAFDRSSWRDLVDWLAKESKLSLHVGDLPQGTFTYSDPNSYTPTQAIERVNLFLIPEGFSIVRSADLLSVISLTDPKSLQQLDAMARLVSVEEIDQLGDQEVVKCFLSLEGISPTAAAGQLTQLQLLAEPLVLSDSKQLMVTGTAKQLASVRAVLASLREVAEKNKPVVESLQLRYLLLDEFLELAGPHLGIEPGRSGNEELNISTEQTQQRLFVSGKPDAIELLSELILKIDTPDNKKPPVERLSDEFLQSHRVPDQNLQAVFDVLQTVLADEPIRLSMEPATNSIVALAGPEIHRTIQTTIDELQGEDVEFSIVELKTLDPYFAITLLDEMFDIAKQSSVGPDSVKVDADPNSLRLFIRGPKGKVAEVKQAIDQLDNQDHTRQSRVVPVFGSKAQRILQEAERSWLGAPVDATTNHDVVRTAISERVVADEHASPKAPDRVDVDSHESIVRPAGFVSVQQDPASQATSLPTSLQADVTPRGIVLKSEDERELAAFEDHVRRVAETEGDTPLVQTIVYYLKYSTANIATRMLADMLDGTTSLLDDATSSKLVNGVVASPATSALGTYLRSTEGAMMVNSGTLSVIADARLNRLICMGTRADLSLVEQFLEVIDKDQSLTEIETRGVARVIKLEHTKAEEIAKLIRDAYGNRVALNSAQRTDLERQVAASKNSEITATGNKLLASSSQEAQMSLAIHEASNALVVTAPKPLFEEVQKLVRELDAQNAQSVEVLWYPGAAKRLQSLRDLLTDER